RSTPTTKSVFFFTLSATGLGISRMSGVKSFLHFHSREINPASETGCKYALIALSIKQIGVLQGGSCGGRATVWEPRSLQPITVTRRLASSLSCVLSLLFSRTGTDDDLKPITPGSRWCSVLIKLDD